MEHAAPHSALGRLEILVGEWELQASVEGQPIPGRGRTVFEWLEGGAFLVQHADVEPAEVPAEWVASSPFPVTTIIGLDDSTEQFCMLWADARGVFRVYQMSLRDGVWKLWRDAPGFFQRFTASVGEDGNTITGRWEKSADGSSWEPDLDMAYTKVR
jgi:hypothetical protein